MPYPPDHPGDWLEEATALLLQEGRLLLKAYPGAGKSTLFPLRLLKALPGRILLFEPRRVAARAVAARLAENLPLPSGKRRRLTYREGAPPLLSLRIQEAFGLRETPRVLEGRVAVAVELLSPAGRPVQVTQDLKSFWENRYPEVRRELMRRYPKHVWPETP